MTATEFQEFYDPIALVVIALLTVSLLFGLGLAVRGFIKEFRRRR